MIMRVLSVFDLKVKAFGRPWFAMSDDAALREFTDAVNDGSNPNNLWFRHPEDFVLYVIGDFDDVNGSVSSIEPEPIAKAVHLKRTEVRKPTENELRDAEIDRKIREVVS